jgi:serine beta-lactamase-like protein LACTB
MVEATLISGSLFAGRGSGIAGDASYTLSLFQPQLYEATMKTIRCVCLATIAISSAFLASALAEEPMRKTDYTKAIAKIEQAVLEELTEHQLHGMAVALVDDQKIVYSAGFGNTKRDSIFRAGSISKLFNAVAIMQLVEQGKLDLDVPIQTYGSQFSLIVPFDNVPAITLRQLLCHRSGMIRESPVGGYFDFREPGLANTVTSIRSCVLVNPPNMKTRYSNVGPSIAGQILATVTGMDYARYQQEHLLKPLGMASSSFLLADTPRQRLAKSYMRVADGHGGFTQQEAPVFDLGTIPAGNLFTTAEDLARFVSMLAAGGNFHGRQIVSPATLDQMTRPQLIKEESGFGLGFMVAKFHSHKSVSHTGSVYGHSTALLLLPEPKLGAIFLCNDDCVNGNVTRLTNLAMARLLEAKLGEPFTPPPAPIRMSPEELAPFAGDYESANTWAKLEVKDGQLMGKLAGHSVRFLPIEPLKFLVDGRASDRFPATFERDASGKVTSFVTFAGQKFVRIASAANTDPCPLWKSYLGSYGPSFIPLVVSVRYGHLYAMTENLCDYRLTPVNRNVFAFPAGLYADEYLVFLTSVDGKVCGVNLANMTLPRN